MPRRWIGVLMVLLLLQACSTVEELEDVPVREKEQCQLPVIMPTYAAHEEFKTTMERRTALANYVVLIKETISRNWRTPTATPSKLKCVAYFKQREDGCVVHSEIRECEGNDAVKKSVLRAIKFSSPLPLPVHPDLFEEEILLQFETP